MAFNINPAPDQRDFCQICGREIPPGPDFCSNDCRDKSSVIYAMTKEKAVELLEVYGWCSKHGVELKYHGLDTVKSCTQCVEEKDRTKKKIVNRALQVLGFKKWVG